MHLPKSSCLAVALACTLAAAAPLRAQTYAPGQDVQVREGDVWSPAKLLKQEGRRYQIQYSDGTDEWIGADRLRPAGAATEPSHPIVTAWFKVGDVLDAKRGAFWAKARVVHKQRNWTLVAYDDGKREWVEPYRLRKSGSTQDVDGWFQNDQMAASQHHGPPATEPAYSAAEKKEAEDRAAAAKRAIEERDADPTYRFKDDPAYRDASDADAAPLLSELAVTGPWSVQPDPAPEKKVVLRRMHVPLGPGREVHFRTPQAAPRPRVLAVVREAFKEP